MTTGVKVYETCITETQERDKGREEKKTLDSYAAF